jgi:hypothetical protein
MRAAQEAQVMPPIVSSIWLTAPVSGVVTTSGSQDYSEAVSA